MGPPDRLPADPSERAAIVAAHDAAVAEGAAAYPDPATGLFVFTSAYLSSVGACCGRGCRHCPYPTPPD